MLIPLEKHNKLTKVLSILKDKCKETAHNGTQVSTFMSKRRKNMVYKLTPNGIGYFHCFSGATHNDFMTDICRMDGFFQRIEKIVYVDKYTFLYTQKRVKKLTLKNSKSTYVALSVLILIYAMIYFDRVATDIGKHNLATYKNNVVLFDVQGVRTLIESKKIRLVKHTLEALNVCRYKNNVNITNQFYENRDLALSQLGVIIMDIYKSTNFKEIEGKIILVKLKQLQLIN